jgi:methionyl-tRNA formyltransferase
MRVVFMGTPEFAVPSLAAIAEIHRVECVYTKPDAISGRGGARRPSPVAEFADSVDIAVRKPSTLRDPAEVEALQLLSPDIIVVAAYGLILPQDVLDVPRYGCVNVHASLLPRWRGAAPVQRAILAGDKFAGVSIMRMEAGLDTGPYCQVEALEIGDSDAEELTRRLAEIGADAVTSALEHIEHGTCDWTLQEETEVTYAEKITKDEIAVTPQMPAETIVRHVRASSKQAPVRIRIAEKPVTLLSAALADAAASPGELVVVGSAVVLGGSDGSVLVERVRPDGKSDMSAGDWARGARLGTGTTWGSAR